MDDLVKRIGPVVAMAAALLAVIGVTSGMAGKVLRDQPVSALVAFAIMLLAVLITVLASSRFQLGYGLTFFFASLLLFSAISISTSLSPELPQLSADVARIEGSLFRITVKLKADGLSSSEFLYFVGRGDLRAIREEGFGGGLADDYLSELYTAKFGPDASGAVDVTFSFDVESANVSYVYLVASRRQLIATGVPTSCVAALEPSSLSNSSAEEASAMPSTVTSVSPALAPKESCVALNLPTSKTLFPSLEISSEHSKSEDPVALTVKVKSNTNSMRLVGLYLWIDGALENPIIEQTIVPDGHGSIDTELHFSMPAGVEVVCAVAVAFFPYAEFAKLPFSSPSDVAPRCNNQSTAFDDESSMVRLNLRPPVTVDK